MDVLLFLIFTNNTNNNTTYHNLNKCSLKYCSIKRFYTALHSVVSTVSYVCTWLLNSVIVLFSRQVPDWNLLHLYSVRYIKLKRLRTSNTYTSLCSFYIWILRPYWKVFLFETHANTHTHTNRKTRNILSLPEGHFSPPSCDSHFQEQGENGFTTPRSAVNDDSTAEFAFSTAAVMREEPERTWDGHRPVTVHFGQVS